MSFVLSKSAIALLLVMAIVSRVSFGAVYKVGDDAGWSIPNAQSVNYNAWAEAIDFHVGDILCKLKPF